MELGFCSTPALPRSVCCPQVALQQNPEPLLKLPTPVHLDLLFLRFFFLRGVCAYFRILSTQVSPALRKLQSVVIFSAWSFKTFSEAPRIFRELPRKDAAFSKTYDANFPSFLLCSPLGRTLFVEKLGA